MKLLILALYLVTTAAAFFFRKECLVKLRGETNIEWKGSHLDITSWIPEKEEQDAPLLTLTLEYSKVIGVVAYDKIEVWYSYAKIRRFRDGEAKNETLNFTPLLKNGWADFNFTTEGRLELWHKPSTKVLSLVKDKKILWVNVDGSNVTINCPELSIGWRVDKKYVSIPLQTDGQESHFSFSSNYDIKPTVGIEQQSVRLGWEESRISDVTRLAETFQEPLPKFLLHNFTVSCFSSSSKSTCKFKDEQHILAEFKTMFDMNTLPKWFTVSSDNPALVYFHRHDALSPTTPAPSNITSDVSSDSESKGYAAAIVTLAVICLGFVAGNVIIYKHSQKLPKNKVDIKTVVQEALKEVSGVPSPSSSYSSLSSKTQLEPKMWGAVVDNDVRYTEYLLRQGINPTNLEKGHSTTPYEEAHILGKKDVLQVIRVSRNEEQTTPSDDLITKVMTVLQKRIDSIFVAASYGMYEQDQGVKLQLINYSLPGSIRDKLGSSLLHYMASKSFMDGRPAWEAADIKHFLENQEFCINAIDHQGNTVLHTLAMRRRAPEKKVFWNGEEQTLSQTWLGIAKILISYGCDPRITNHRGDRPHELATSEGNHDISDLFREKVDSLGSINLRDSVKESDQLVNAARKGNTNQLRKLLLRHVPLLPICANSDPLVEAIRHCQWNAVLLLISAGTPLCNRSIADLTPLEAAHSTLGIPACFPALLRKAYSDLLEYEISQVPETEKFLKSLQLGMKNFKQQVQENGSASNWTLQKEDYRERSKEAREILTQASELGLTLTCQILGTEDVDLHPLPGEVNPFKMAILNKHTGTQFALYRDLYLSPFTLPSSVLEMLSSELLEDIHLSSFVILEKFLSEYTDSQMNEEAGTKMQLYIENLKKRYCHMTSPDDIFEDPPLLLLYLLSRLGLTGILHMLLRDSKNLNIDTTVEEYSKSTLLHVASMYGNITLVELLIYRGANMSLTTIGGFTATHLAALWGHKECFTYIMASMVNQQVDCEIKCQLGLTPTELVAERDSFCGDYLYPFIPREDTLYIKNFTCTDEKAYELLKKRSTVLNIKDTESFLNSANEFNVNKSDTEMVLEEAKKIARNICKQINDPRLQGEIKSVGHLSEGNELFNIIDAKTIYELENLHSTGSSPTINREDIVSKAKDTVVKVTSSVYQDISDGEKFRDIFLDSIREVIAKDQELTPGITIAPPFIKATFKGVSVYTVWFKDNKFRFIKIRIAPCLRSEVPDDSKVQSLPEIFHLYFKNENFVHLAPRKDDSSWYYRGYNHESAVYGHLDENQKTVWLSCRLISLLLYNTWWFPIVNTKRYRKPWHTAMARGSRLAERVLKAMFLEELAESQNWDKDSLFDRVCSVFKRAAYKDKDGHWISKGSVHSFITPRHYHYEVDESITGVIRFLDYLKEEFYEVKPQGLKPDKDVKHVSFRNRSEPFPT